jgi:hypothetical protein
MTTAITKSFRAAKVELFELKKPQTSQWVLDLPPLTVGYREMYLSKPFGILHISPTLLTFMFIFAY